MGFQLGQFGGTIERRCNLRLIVLRRFITSKLPGGIIINLNFPKSHIWREKASTIICRILLLNNSVLIGKAKFHRLLYFGQSGFASFVNASLAPTTPPISQAGFCIALFFTDIANGNKWQITFKHKRRHIKNGSFKGIHHELVNSNTHLWPNDVSSVGHCWELLLCILAVYRQVLCNFDRRTRRKNHRKGHRDSIIKSHIYYSNMPVYIMHVYIKINSVHLCHSAC